MLTGVPTSPGAGLGPVHCTTAGPPPAGSVVTAADVAPGDIGPFHAAGVLAVATASGAPLSHAAILARSLGLPLVTGLGPDLLRVPAGTLVLVDGASGAVHVGPAPELVASVRAGAAAAQDRTKLARHRSAEPAVTRDGRTVPVLVNVGSTADARAAVAEGADGVGMLRTEFAFLDCDEAPGEEDQYRAYRDIAGAIGERPLVVRTLDLGADIPVWGGATEPNPALGHRGLRFTLAARHVFETQLRAIVRLAADRPLRVMFPMVTTVDEVREARACLAEVMDATPGADARRVEVGITVEVPAAALTAEVLAPLVDFFAVGTNDLTQYTLAADRANWAVAGLVDGLHPAVLRLVREVAAAAARHGRAVEVVGELACDPVAIPLLLGLGVDELSVRPNAVPAVKEAVRAVRLDEAARLASAALEAESAGAVRRLCAPSGMA